MNLPLPGRSIRIDIFSQFCRLYLTAKSCMIDIVCLRELPSSSPSNITDANQIQPQRETAAQNHDAGLLLRYGRYLGLLRAWGW